MAERVRRFRVVNAFRACKVDAGDIGEYRGLSGAGLMLFYNSKWSSGRADRCVSMFHYDVEELPTFAVGDVVRVKAGSPVYLSEPGLSQIGPYSRSFGKKLVITHDKTEARHVDDDGYWYLVHEDGSKETGISGCYLEPWKDAEEWDGSKWVAKKPERTQGYVNCKACGKSEWDSWVDKPDDNYRCRQCESTPKPAIVCLREDGKLALGCAVEHASTNAAFSAAQRAAEMFPGKEYVVLQEKGSKRVEPKPSAAEVVALAVSGEITDRHMSGWTFRDGTRVGVVPVHMEWDHGSDEVTIRVRCHHKS